MFSATRAGELRLKIITSLETHHSRLHRPL